MSIENTRRGTLTIRRELVRSVFPILVFVFTISCTATVTAETRANQEMLGSKNWPTTVDQAVDDILPRLSRFEKLKIKLTKKENIISLYPDLGTSIRNRYGLWQGNEKLMLSACPSRCHPDDASMKIIEAVWRELQK